jgi:uncharacterized cupredoxin-like copper-binding protein
MNLTRTLIALALLAASTASLAHGEKPHAKPAAPLKMEQKDWGIGGAAAAVKRTVTIRMTDNMRLHEFVLGTKQELDEHAELMKKFPNMEHDEPYMAHVEPGKQGDIVWHFNRAGEFDFACLLPGHYQAGMVGKIKVAAL